MLFFRVSQLHIESGLIGAKKGLQSLYSTSPTGYYQSEDTVLETRGENISMLKVYVLTHYDSAQLAQYIQQPCR